jgi:hypothetical protein
MIRRVAITLLAVIIAAFRLVRRRKQVSAREIVAARIATISERMREGSVNLGDAVHEKLPLECQNEAEAVRDFQAQWLRDRLLITSDSLLATVQVVRASITHVVGEEARAVLDDLQRQAHEHPEGVPGYIVADARVKFNGLMRANLQ